MLIVVILVIKRVRDRKKIVNLYLAVVMWLLFSFIECYMEK